MRQLIALAVLALTVYGIVDCVRADERDRKGIPLWAWIVLMVVLPGVGAIIWLISSRLGSSGASAPRPGPVAPDDDPEFLRELEWRNRRRRAHESDPDDPAENGGQSGNDQPAG
ncbi:MAG: PLD nuclease N-terminal domain-containing protein [Beutenbergiaceae bacterium]